MSDDKVVWTKGEWTVTRSAPAPHKRPVWTASRENGPTYRRTSMRECIDIAEGEIKKARAKASVTVTPEV